MARLLKPEELRWRAADLTLIEKVLRDRRLKKHGHPGAVGQERALSALEMGLGIKERGFNIFVVGSSGTGRTSTVKHLLKERAAAEPAPDDYVLLYNFEDRDRPHAIPIPASRGPRLKKTYEAMIKNILTDLEKVFDSDRYIEQRQKLEDQFQKRTDQLLNEIEDEALEQGFLLSRSGAALTITPQGEEGDPITEEEYNAMSAKAQAALENKAEKLEAQLEETLRKITAEDREAEEALNELARETADKVVDPRVEHAQSLYRDVDAIIEHLNEVHEDILNRLNRLVPSLNRHGGHEEEEHAMPPMRLPHEEEQESDEDEPALLRYKVNVLVTRSKTAGAPVVHETHPTISNIIGRIEHRVRSGETITDFTRIRGGALYRANGGYLILEAQDLLREPNAWEGLKRALKNRQVELDDPGEPGRMLNIVSLRPEPVSLTVKVCLIGTPEIFYFLTSGDPDFGKLFKVKADFDIEMDNTEDHIRKYLRFLVGLSHQEKLRKLTPEGAARVLEHAARLSDNQNKLTTQFGQIADLVREANFWATRAKSRKIDAVHVNEALKKRQEREGWLEAHFLEEITTGKVRIETSGAVIGQVNGLTVLESGSYSFGMPARLTCKVGAGRGEFIDIERETELGGPIHTKGNLILKGLISDRFGREHPLCLSATNCFEQSYMDVDGDSATMAEACALLSAIGRIPVKQEFAMTGSLDQRGNVQAVGGINEKIEGFYQVCKSRGIDQGPYSVIIPDTNSKDLMLNDEVLAAVEHGAFRVYTAKTLEEAMELVTGRDWDDGEWSITRAVTEHLRELRKVHLAGLPGHTTVA
ncbi:MAG: ATP-dependent protease [Myxococcales bacterium]|nr:ATP-dependent protease [Myxococcales bacterium]